MARVGRRRGRIHGLRMPGGRADQTKTGATKRMRTKVHAKAIIGSTWRYRGTKHSRIAGERVVIKAVRRFDHVDGDTVTLKDDGLIQSLRKGDKIEVAQVVDGENGNDRESYSVDDASPEDLEPLEPPAATERRSFGRRW